MVGAVATHHRALAGVHAATGQRTQFTFDNPNMAANYFFVSLFILVAARCPSNRLARAGAILMVLGAIVVTGSNAALLGLPLAGLLVTFVVIRRRADVVSAIAVVLVALRKRRTKDNRARQELYAHLVSENCSLLARPCPRASASVQERHECQPGRAGWR